MQLPTYLHSIHETDYSKLIRLWEIVGYIDVQHTDTAQMLSNFLKRNPACNYAAYVDNKSDKFDALLIDGFDEDEHSVKLSSAGFYDNCYSKLRDDGVMAVNLLGSETKFGTYTSRMRDSFEDKVVVVDSEDDGNKIAFAYKGKDFPLSRDTLLDRVSVLGSKHPISLHNTAQKILQRLNVHTSHSEWEQPFGVGA